jgi:hypothetical protein
MTGLAIIYQQFLRIKLYFSTISNSNRNGGKFRQFGPGMFLEVVSSSLCSNTRLDE